MKSSCGSHMLAAIAFAGTLQITQAGDLLNARLTDPSDQGECSMPPAQLGETVQRSGTSSTTPSQPNCEPTITNPAGNQPFSQPTTQS